MARRYVRDNRGRFASTGATARGGRLRTAAGNKRATVKGKIEGAVPGGTIRPGRRSKPKAVEAPTSGRQHVRGNFRPKNTMAKPAPQENPFNKFSGHSAENIATARKALERKGYKTYEFNDPNNPRIAEASIGVRSIGFNRGASYWENPRLRARENRRVGHHSTAAPMGVIHHEIGHTKDKAGFSRFQAGGRAGMNDWKSVAPAGAGPVARLRSKQHDRTVAHRVSHYAATSPTEFVAEVYAGRRTGHKYDHEVMRTYGRASGRRARSVRSQLKK